MISRKAFRVCLLMKSGIQGGGSRQLTARCTAPNSATSRAPPPACSCRSADGHVSLSNDIVPSLDYVMLFASSTSARALKENRSRGFAVRTRWRALRGAGALLRRIVAALALLTFFGSGAEAVEGMLRDGEVHHESGALAAAHAGLGGEHGHEDGPLSDHSEHGTGHQHGTNTDHCTHQHGTALPAGQNPAPRLCAEVLLVPDAPGRLVRISTTLFHPPRA